MLTLAFVSEMLEMAFPGTYAAGGKLDVRFKAPVYPGETVETWGEIISVKPAGQGNLARCRAGCRKLDGTEVATGHATVPLPRSPDETAN
jgi:acyl dehydratase